MRSAALGRGERRRGAEQARAPLEPPRSAQTVRSPTARGACGPGPKPRRARRVRRRVGPRGRHRAVARACRGAGRRPPRSVVVRAAAKACATPGRKPSRFRARAARRSLVVGRAARAGTTRVCGPPPLWSSPRPPSGLAIALEPISYARRRPRASPGRRSAARHSVAPIAPGRAAAAHAVRQSRRAPRQSRAARASRRRGALALLAPHLPL